MPSVLWSLFFGGSRQEWQCQAVLPVKRVLVTLVVVIALALDAYNLHVFQSSICLHQFLLNKTQNGLIFCY